MYFESRVIEYVRTFRYTWRVPFRIRANSDPNTELFAQCTNSLSELCCSALSIATPSAGVPTGFVAISTLWNLSGACH